jgi:uncharacterized MAPEG superfamily protein
MSLSILALIGYAAWTMVLLASIAALRVRLTWQGVRPANGFAVSGDDVSPFSGRLCRAHANCYENLPVFAAIVIAAVFSGSTQLTDPLALWLLAARVAQSSVHMMSTRNWAVMWRFTCLLGQFCIQACWIILLLCRSSG